MLIRYVGPGVRIIHPYVWDQSNGFVADVCEPELAANLLTYPYPEFVLMTDEPLLAVKGIGEQTAAELALAGVATLAQLAELDETGIERVAASIHGSKKQVTVWVKQARKVEA
jgi:predicted flap endonuclease-1-like 5' DNA nuclease